MRPGGRRGAEDGRPGRARSPEGWARPWAGWLLALVAVGGSLELVLGPTRPFSRAVRRMTRAKAAPGVPRVLSKFDFAAMGNDAAMDYLRTLEGGGAHRVVERARAAVVRFRATAEDTEKQATHWSNGSGVLVNGGRHVLVAGHCLDSLAKEPGLELSVYMTDGRPRKGRVPAVRGGVDGAPDGDWGLVELEGTPPWGCPSLRMRAAAAGATVVLLGYSGGFGVDDKGKAYPADEALDAPLLPLAFVGRVVDAGSGRVDLVAGAPPAGGASGGAIVDLQGYLVGIMESTESAWSSGHVVWSEGRILPPGESVFRRTLEGRFRFTGTPVGVFQEFLQERWSR